MTATNEQMLARYLLGDLPDTERERIEKEYFISDEAWELLSAVEDELIDSYIRGRLSKQQQEQFRHYFLQSPRRRERYELALLLMAPAVRQSPREAPLAPDAKRRSQTFWSGVFQWMAAPQPYAVVTILMLLTCAFLIMQNHRLRLQLEEMRSVQTTLQGEVRAFRESAARANAPQNESDANQIFGAGQMPVISILLEPGNVRTPGESNTRQIPQLTTMPASIVLALDLRRDDYSQYSARIQTVDGHIVREETSLQSRRMDNGGRTVLVKFPSGLLSKGDYIVWLAGQNASSNHTLVDSYLFSVN